MDEINYYYYEEGYGWKRYVLNKRAEKLNDSLFIFLEENLAFVSVSFLFAACLCGSPAAAAEILKIRPSVVETITSISETSLSLPVVAKSAKNLGKRRRLGTFAETFYGAVLVGVFESENAVREKNVLRYFETLNFDLKNAKFQNSNINSYFRINGGALPSFSILQNGLKFVNYYFSRNSEKRNSKKENFDFSGFTAPRERKRSNISKGERFYSVPVFDIFPIGVLICFILFKKDKLQNILTTCFERMGLLEKETPSEKKLLRLKKFFVENKYSLAVILIFLVIMILVLKNKNLSKLNPISLAFELIGSLFGEYNRFVSMTIGVSNRRTDEALSKLNRLAEDNQILVQQLHQEKLLLVRKLSIEEMTRRGQDVDILQCKQNFLDAQKSIGSLEFKVKQQKEFIEGLEVFSVKQQITPKPGLFGSIVNRITGNEKDEHEMKYLDMTQT
jgi:hypothetical protein